MIITLYTRHLLIHAPSLQLLETVHAELMLSNISKFIFLVTLAVCQVMDHQQYTGLRTLPYHSLIRKVQSTMPTPANYSMRAGLSKIMAMCLLCTTRRGPPGACWPERSLRLRLIL